MQEDNNKITKGTVNNIFSGLLDAMNALLRRRHSQLIEIEKELGVHPEQKSDDKPQSGIKDEE